MPPFISALVDFVVGPCCDTRGKRFFPHLFFVHSLPASPGHTLERGAVTTAPTSCWLSIDEAERLLGCDRAGLSRFVERELLTAYEIPGLGVRFRGDDLDRLPTPIPPEEAARRLLDDDLRSEDSIMPAPVTASIEPVVPLKVAAEALGMPYKTLLGLAHRGAIPATDLNASTGCRRPRYVVGVASVRQALQQQGEKQAVMRRCPPQAVDLLRLAGQTRGRR